MPSSRLRTCIEPALILLLCGGGIVALLAWLGPTTDPLDRIVECGLLMAVVAGPLIAWRLARRSTRTIIIITITVLLTGVGFSALAWDFARARIRDQARTEFEQLTDRLRSDAERRVNLPVYGLKGARGAYAASKLLERAEFRAYVESRDLAHEFPGVLGIGFIQRVMRPDLDAFIEAERADDAPDFTVRSQGDADDLFVVKFIDPLEQNRAAWGYDVGAEPTRRIAIERSMRTGQPTLTGCIRLVQDALDRAGFLYLVPIYRHGSKPTTPAEREEALVGLTYAALLIDDIFADTVELADGRLDVEVHDEGVPEGSSLLFSAVQERASAPEDSPPAMFADVKYVHVGGRTWTMTFRTTAAFEQALDRTAPVLTAMLGLLVSAALATLVWSLARGRERALALAREMTQELRISEAHAQRARAEAERDERRFRTLVEGADVIVWEYDTALSAFTYVSPQAAKLGYPLEQWLVPGFWQETLHPEDRDGAIAFCAAQVAAGQDHRFQYRMQRADGQSVWVDDFVSLELVAGTTPILRGVLVDITQRKQDEEALVQARVAADAANNAKSQFLANMSHEIRTPLTAILGYADLLRDDSSSDVESQERLQTIDTIRAAGQHLLTVINDILDLSKIEAGCMTVETIPTSIVDILQEIESLMRPRAAGKGVALTFKLLTPLPEKVMSDPTRLRQLLLNIVGNATKFTDIGSITVTVGAERRENMPRMVIAVEDTGVGFAVEDAGRLFKPFTQGDASVTRKHGGTGLGLVICQRLAELMGGSVRLAWTVKGKGSCFRIEIPLIAAEGAAMITTYAAIHDEQRTPSANGSVNLSGRVLLAEDGLDNQRLVSFHLRKAGAEVDIAEHGIQALEMLARAEADGRPYDLLLSDMQMPEMDGYTLARTLRAHGSTLPIIALTAHAMGEDRTKCIDAGCDDYATKPIDQRALLAMCGRWIRPTDGTTPRARAA